MIGLIIWGLPASGKGTQCEKLTADFNLSHVNTGESIRAEIERQTGLGKEAAKFVAEGELVSGRLVEEVIDEIFINRLL